MRIIGHQPFGVVPGESRAAEPLENADLNFMRAERDEPVESSRKALQRFAVKGSSLNGG
jgi:hypothetical protein